MESNMQKLLAELGSIEYVLQHTQLVVDCAHRARQDSRQTRQRAAALRPEAQRLRGPTAVA